jgi:hypothetical protein
VPKDPQFHLSGPATQYEPDPFRVLSEKLRSIAARAARERWSGWTEDDDRAVAAAAAEIEGIVPALADGMRQAFDIGREYGHREELLERLNAEIGEISGRLARQAWGRDSRGTDRTGPLGDGLPDG